MHRIFSKASAQTSCVDIMTQKGNDVQVGNSSTRATEYILRSLGWNCFTNYVLRASWKRQMIRQVACVTSLLRSCANRWTIFMWLLIDHRLANTNRYQLTNFIDWYRLINWFSNHRFPSIGYSGNYYMRQKKLILQPFSTHFYITTTPPSITVSVNQFVILTY